MPKDSFFDFLFQLSAKNQRKRTEQQRERREQPAKRSEQQRNGHPWRRLPAVETLTKRQLLAANLGAVTETAADTLTVDLDTQSLAGTRDANAEVTFQYGLRSGAVGAGTGGTDVLLAGDLSGAGFDQVIAVRQVDGVLQFLGDTDRDTGDEYRFRFGSADFTPLIADMNADGIDDIVVVDTQTPSNLLEWYVSYGLPGANPFPSDDSTLTVDAAFNFGVDGDNALAVTGVPDMPRVGDLNGDGRADVFAVRDDGTNLDWYVSTEDAFPNSTSTFLDLDLTVDNFGVSASIPVVGDWAETGVRDYFGFITESASPSVWNLDSDGDFTVDITPSFGTSGSQYIAGNWADVQWDGSAGDNLFSNAANWSGDAVPTTGQSVVIDQPGATPVVVADISETLGDLATRESLRTQAGDLIIGGELRAEGSVEVAGGTLRLESASSIGSVNLQAGELILDAAVTTPSLAFDGGGLAVTTGASVSDLFFDVSAAGGSIRADGGGPVIFGNRFNLTGDLTVGGTEQLVLSGDIDGAGGLVKIDSASLRLTNNNGYAGETLINGGEIFLTDNGLLGSGAGDTRIGANATLRLDANRTISENLILDGDGARVRMADGSLLSGSVEIAGAGTYRIEPTLSGDTFTIAGSVFQSLSHDGLQIGTTGVDSRVIVPGNLNVESGVQLVGGTLEVNGSLTTTPARPLVLNSNTTLAGTGAIAGAVSANFNSRIEPGSDRGTLAFSGELEMQAGSFLEIEIGGTEPGTLPSNHDQIVFDGSRLDLESGLQLLVNGPNPTNGDSITLLRREGTDPNAFVFGGLPEGGVAVDDRGNRYRITYVGGDGNDVVLTADSTASTSIVVTTAADAGVGTLRDAILRAQSAPGLDTIEFDIPGTGPHRIQLVDPLPQINSQVILDGYTQPGASPNTSPAGFNANLQIIVDGGIPDAGITLGLLSDGSTVRGLNIQNSNRGLTVNQSGGHTIVGNAIGTDVTGTLAQGNSQGIRIQSGEGTRVGTPDVADRNLISGQTQAGVTISGATTGLNFIQNNLIGVDASGVRPLGNGTFGVHLQDQTFGNLIGGNGSGEANVIAASGAEGVRLQNVANGNQIIGNRIGTDVSSTLALGNQTDGILVLSEATNTVIADNVISGNTDDGIRVSGGTIDGTDIRGNRIGVNESGNRHIDGTLALWTVEGGLVTDVVGENQPSSTAGLSFPAGLSGDAVSTWPSGHIEIPEGNLNPEQLTLDAWVRPDGPSDNADSVGGRIVGKNVASGESISLYWRSQDDRFLFFYGRNNAEQIISTHSFPTGDWYHIAVTYDGDTARMFVNGVLEAEKTSGTPLPYNPAEPWTIGSSAAFYRGQGFPRRFNGPIDEVGLYDRALSPEEIRAIAADGTASKSASLGNLGNGIVVNAGATNTTIGGTTPEDRNIISDNDLSGVLIQTATTSNLTLTGNYIGVDGSGSRDLGNGVAGVRIEGSPNHTVGGSVPGAGNVISGNATGIEVLGLDSAGTVIAGNLIGVDATGMSAIGNDIGITIGDGTADSPIDTLIGGSSIAERNVVAGNTNTDVNVLGDRVRVMGNYVGVNAEGSAAISTQFAISTRGDLHFIGTDSDGVNDDAEGNLVGSLVNGAGQIRVQGDSIRVAGNQIGLAAGGETELAGLTGGHGIEVFNSSQVIIGTDGNGVSDSAERNTVVGGENSIGIALQNSGLVRVAGNYIGLNSAGTATRGSITNGIQITNSDGLIVVGTNGDGSGDAIEGNLIAGTRTGISASGTAPGPIAIAGNRIGLDVTGQVALGGQVGIAAFGTGIRIGAQAGAALVDVERNVISGQIGSATNPFTAAVFVNAASDVEIRGNRIGTDLTGTVPLGKRSHPSDTQELAAITVLAGSGAIIGGSSPGEGNLIADSDFAGIEIRAAASDTLVQGNLIGTDETGNLNLGNAGAGVLVASDATIGSDFDGNNDAGEGNVIAFSGDAGIVVDTATAVAMRGNSIYESDGLAIDLGGDGVTANDPGDADTGANNLQNFPVLTAASAGATSEVSGTFTGDSGIEYALDFYASDAADPSGHGEAARYIGSTTLIATGQSDSFTASGLGTTVAGEVIAVTVSRLGTATSELSLSLAATDPNGPAIEPGSLIVTVIEGSHVHGDDDDGDNDEINYGLPTNVVDEGDLISLTGLFSVPAPGQELEIDWGDGTVTRTGDANLSIRENGFNASHVYVDDRPSGTPMDRYAIRVLVINPAANTSGYSSRSVDVRNVSATFGEGGLSVAPVTTGEGSSITLSGTVVDPGQGEVQRLEIDWGDGSPTQIEVLSDGQTDFAFDHIYTNDSPSPITVTLSDDDGGMVTATAVAEIINLAPIALIAGPTTATEGDTLTFTAASTDPGVGDVLTHRWTVRRDGEAILEIDGETLTWTPDDQQDVTIELLTTDDGGLSAAASRLLSVQNDAPEFVSDSIEVLGTDAGLIFEGGRVTLRGQFDDAGVGDAHTLTVAWGDGVIDTIGLDIGRRDFELSHVYQDDDPAGTARDDFEISIHLDDDDGGIAETSRFVTVANVAPEVQLIATLIDDSTARLVAEVRDVPGDALQFQWLINDAIPSGVVSDEATLEVDLNALPADTRVSVSVSDDDTGVTVQETGLVSGSAAADTIVVSDAGGDIQVSVTTGASSETSNFSGVDAVVVLGGGADDDIQAGAGLTASLIIDGGTGDDTITTADGNDYVDGGEGNDVIQTGAGDDVISSALGDDTLDSGLGNDSIFIGGFSDKTLIDAGGIDTIDFSRVPASATPGEGVSLDLSLESGQIQNVRSDGQVSLSGRFENLVGSNFDDEFTGSAEANLIFGGLGDDIVNAGPGDDEVYGGDGDDRFVGAEGNDLIFGGFGNDVIDPGVGDDLIEAGDGDDVIAGSAGNDLIFGGPGADIVQPGPGNARIDGGDGDDRVEAGGGNDLIFGGPGIDVLTPGDGDDEVYGGEGDDEIIGGLGKDLIFGGPGNDVVTAGDGDEVVYGGDGNDRVTGSEGNDLIFGGPGEDVVTAGRGNALIDGGEGNDIVDGGEGNDLIFGGPGDDVVSAGDGDDVIRGDGGDDILIAGSTGNDLIFGGPGHDEVVGGAGAETVYGGEGDDLIRGGAGGNDLIFGGPGSDTIELEAGEAIVYGDDGDDSIIGGKGNDLIFGGFGVDTLTGGAGDDRIDGGDGDDLITGSAGNDLIFGGLGNDRVEGAEGNETVRGGPGDDFVRGAGGNDIIFGGPGIDDVDGGIGNDTVYGDEGDDMIGGGLGNDLIFGGPGDDLVLGAAGDDNLNGGLGHDIVRGGEANDLIFGGLGNDEVEGGLGNDMVYGEDGNDLIRGSVGNDFIFGGPGRDVVIGGAGEETIDSGPGDDRVDGGDGNDLLYGDVGNDLLLGGAGNDTIEGGSGSDILRGGIGDDILRGGQGNDQLDGEAGLDIVDGDAGDDRLQASYGSDTLRGGTGIDDFLVESFLLLDHEPVQIFGGTDVAADDDADRLIATTPSNLTLTDTAIQINGLGNVTFSDIQTARLVGSDDANVLDASGFSGPSTLVGLGDDDLLIGGPAADVLDPGGGLNRAEGRGGDDRYVIDPGSLGIGDRTGNEIVELAGSGTDLLDFSRLPRGVTVDLADAEEQMVAPALNVTLIGPPQIEGVSGTDFVDKLLGNESANILIGLGGRDHLDGRGGDDHIEVGSTRRVYLDFDSQTDGEDHVYTASERLAIEQRIRDDFAAYDVIVQTLTPQTIVPDRGAIIAIFNAGLAPIDGGTGEIIVGGLSQRIGFRELGGTGQVLINVGGFLRPEAELNVDGSDDDDNRLNGTEANYIALSSTIAAHELAHMYGIRHHDSFGPIGSGVFSGADLGGVLPAIQLPRDADETASHIIASPNSVGTSMIDALGDPHFGTRESIKLAFAENGITVTEADDSKAFDSSLNANVQALGALPDLVVPTTIALAGDLPVVAAINVVGQIDAPEEGGVSESDFYSFLAAPGDRLTIEVLSNTLRHRGDRIFDSVVRLYGPDGALVDYGGNDDYKTFNDNSFESIDAMLFDLLIPARQDGTTDAQAYTIEVDTFSFDLPELNLDGVESYLGDFDDAAFCLANPTHPACDDTDHGPYELTIYRYDGTTLTASQSGDTVTTGDGSDTVIGNSGNELLTDFDPVNDLLVDSSGAAATGIDPPRLFDIEAEFSAVEGSTRTVVLGVITTDPTPQWSIEPIAGFAFPADATLDLTLNTIVSLTVGAEDQTDYAVRMVVADAMGQSDFTDILFRFENAPPELAALSLPGAASVGQPYTVRADLFDAGPNDVLSAIVDFGDGTAVPAAFDGDTWTATHVYAANGQYPLRFYLYDGDVAVNALTFSVDVGARDLTIRGTGNDDRVHVEQDDQLLRWFTSWGGWFSAPLDRYDRIVVDGLGGHDEIVIDSSVHLPTRLSGGAGNDDLVGGSGPDEILGGAGNDRLDGMAGDDTLLGGADNDRIVGGDGNDFLGGDAGDDRLVGGVGNDVIRGGDGDDRILGGIGMDVLVGGMGQDDLRGGVGGDLIIAGFTSLGDSKSLWDQVLQEWSSEKSYSERLGNLRSGIGAGASVSLAANATVFDDEISDRVAGQNGRDWFFADRAGIDADDLIAPGLQEAIDELA